MSESLSPQAEPGRIPGRRAVAVWALALLGLGLMAALGATHPWLPQSASGMRAGLLLGLAAFLLLGILRGARVAANARSRARAFSLVVEHSPIAFAITDREGTIEYVNPSYAAMTGHTQAEAHGRRLELQTGSLDEIGRPQWSPHIRARRADGEEYWGRTRVAPVFDELGRLTNHLVVAEDVTEQRATEEDRRSAYQALELVSRGIMITDRHGEPRWVNSAMTTITGYPKGDLLTGGARFLEPDQQAGNLKARIAAAALRRQPWSGQVEYRRRDGARFTNEVTMAPVDIDDEDAGVVVLMQDVTAQRALEAQAAEAQRIETLGRLVGGVAHDFNNLIGVIYGYAEDLLKRMSDGDPGHQELTRILQIAQRAADLSQQLLAFSRRKANAPRLIQINSMLADVHEMLRRLIGEDVELLTIPDLTLGWVRTDPSQIEQVLLNLVINARDAMPEGGRLTIETRNVEIDSEYARRRPPAIEGQFVMMAVTDTGCGMDADTRARVFEPLFTTKPGDKGTGFGLATVFGIVTKNGGFVSVDSEPGEGSCFKVYLPRVEEGTAQAVAHRTTAPRGHETVLLVEDDETARGILVASLKGLGYRVIPASDGEAALELASRTRGEIDLLLTDVVMPGMSGRALAERLATTRPRVRVLYMSGYPADIVAHHKVLDDGVSFIEKPAAFVGVALGEKLRAILDQPRAANGAPGSDLKRSTAWGEASMSTGRSRRRSFPTA